MSSTPNACVLRAPGTNCDKETAFALELAGAEPELVHMSQVEAGDRRLDDYQIVMLPGGFSFGDNIAAGRRQGLEMRVRMADQLNRCHENGAAIVGICNGFQVLVQLGMLPDGQVNAERSNRTASLTTNTSGRFVDRWPHLRTESSTSRYVNAKLIGEVIILPVANKEGRFVRGSESAYHELVENERVVFRYCTPTGIAVEEFPDNPSGSPYGIAAISDESGVVLGMMPHPERFVTAEQHPNRHRGYTIPFGRLLFEQIVAHAREL